MWLILSHPFTICTGVFSLCSFQLRPWNSRVHFNSCCMFSPAMRHFCAWRFHAQPASSPRRSAAWQGLCKCCPEITLDWDFYPSSAELAYLTWRSQGTVHKGLCRERVCSLLCLEITWVTTLRLGLHMKSPNQPSTTHIYHFYTNIHGNDRDSSCPTSGQMSHRGS